MTITVYAWPPVGVVGTEWTEEAPIQRSRSLLTGADYVSTAGRRRRRAVLQVSALARGGMGAGYVEVLKRYLDGGVHAVRLQSTPVNWWIEAQRDAPWRQSAPVGWPADSPALRWFSDTVLSGTAGLDAQARPVVTVTGLPPARLVARPGEYLTAYADAADTVGVTRLVVAPATSDAAGAAVVRLAEALPAWSGVRVNLGSSESAVFRAEDIPRAVQPLASNWTYEWRFREVFADEVGGFQEVDPWR